MTTAEATADQGGGLAGAARDWWTGVRSGQLGSLPIILGLIIIAIVFQSQNDRFLTASNFVNLIVQSAAFATIAMGIVFVLLLGEIDLSVGYVSGVAGVIAAVLLIPDGSQQSTWVAVALTPKSPLLLDRVVADGPRLCLDHAWRDRACRSRLPAPPRPADRCRQLPAPQPRTDTRLPPTRRMK